jgi:hypothetical protein
MEGRLEPGKIQMKRWRARGESPKVGMSSLGEMEKL